MDTNLVQKIRACVHFFYMKLLHPKSHNEDRGRREFILNIILLGSILLIVCLDLSLLHNVLSRGAAYRGVPFLQFSSLIIFFGILYFLSRKGYIKTASYALILFYFFGASYSSYRWGVSLPSVLLTYALIITISGILISSRFGLVLSLIIYVTLTCIGRLEMQAGIVPEWKQDIVTLSDVLVYSIILLLITLISWLSNREIDHSLARARKSEKELILEKELLEIRVEERTKELRHVQAEKMSQLSRLAEFGRLSSGLFHDLVSPLSSVVFNLRGIEHIEPSDLKGVKDQLDRTIRASNRMGTFISAIKKQIRSDELKEIFFIHEIIEEAISLFHYRALKSRIEVTFEIYKKISLFGNPIKFHQIITNLISNALDAYDTVALTEKNRIVKIFLRKQRDSAAIVVIDHGIGISEEVMPRIFDQFFTTKPHDTALGLGLSTTKEIVEKEFGGTIAAESDETEGTKFTVLIPCKS